MTTAAETSRATVRPVSRSVRIRRNPVGRTLVKLPFWLLIALIGLLALGAAGCAGGGGTGGGEPGEPLWIWQFYGDESMPTGKPAAWGPNRCRIRRMSPPSPRSRTFTPWPPRLYAGDPVHAWVWTPCGFPAMLL